MFDSFIKEKRKKLKITMKQLACEVGVSESTVSRWESGLIKDIKGDKLLLLARALKVSPMELMDGNDINEVPLSKIPLIGTVACGLPIWAEENIEDYLLPPCGIKADFALKCRGDSMINARIMDGDIVFVKKTEDVENGQIAVVLIDNEATLKRIYKYPDSIVLQAENPNFKPIIITGQELSNVRIEGIAVGFLSYIN